MKRQKEVYDAYKADKRNEIKNCWRKKWLNRLAVRVPAQKGVYYICPSKCVSHIKVSDELFFRCVDQKRKTNNYGSHGSTTRHDPLIRVEGQIEFHFTTPN